MQNEKGKRRSWSEKTSDIEVVFMHEIKKNILKPVFTKGHMYNKGKLL